MWVLILCVLLVTRSHPSEATSLTSLVKFAQCQTGNLGHVFLQGNAVSLRKCAAHCSKKGWCKGLAFGKNLMLCSLYNDMTFWQQSQSTQGDCAVIYKENITETNFDNVQLEELNECDEFVTVANGSVLGNMNREGNRKQVVCNQGFIIQNGRDVSQCRNGKWTPKPVCIRFPFILCEGKTDTLSCPLNLQLNIIGANYGRRRADYCPGQIRTTDCVLNSSLSTVQTACNERQSCVISATVQMFGSDPCQGTRKYVEVTYECI